MAEKVLVRAVEDKDTDGNSTWTGECICGYKSPGWPMKKHAEAWIKYHKIEHEEGELMPDKAEFISRNKVEF
ncbi:MAG TPA: hypothetical protein VFK94_01945 [Patescibacteria group bacterium]|nr:hypothetical protein [Patescibacteria group bacterium]